MRQSAGIAMREAHPAFGGLLIHWTAAIAAFAILGLAYIVYVLWPRWPDNPATLNAPSLPIVIGDVVFRIPPAAIRRKMQRTAGKQDRIDLAYSWPALTPAAVVPKPASGPSPNPIDRIFVTIAAAPSALTPVERLKTVYPRYTQTTATEGPAGLTALAFRSGTPYRGEDLLYDASAPERFIARCTRSIGPTPGICLYEQFVGGANVTIRFPRDWLSDWRGLRSGFDQLVKGVSPAQ